MGVEVFRVFTVFSYPPGDRCVECVVQCEGRLMGTPGPPGGRDRARTKRSDDDEEEEEGSGGPCGDWLGAGLGFWR